jgi:hypothetical protein
VRGFLIAGVVALMAGCGESADPPGRADRPARADGRPGVWTPHALAAAIGGTVLVAGRATRDDLPDGCPNRPLRFASATIDEFALTATFHGVGEIAGEENTPYVERCTARFDGGWKLEASCEHYAPARPPDGIDRSGSGLIECDLARKVAMLFIDPPEGTRWVVLRRRAGYSVAYPVTRGEPVNVSDPVPDLESPHGLTYRAVSGTGELTELQVEGYVAG